MAQSWFDPDRVFKHFDEYAPLIGTPVDELTDRLQAKFDAELASPEGQARLQALADRLAGDLSRFDDPGMALRIARGFHQVFFLEQLILSLTLGDRTVVEPVGLELAREAAANGHIFAMAHMGPHFIAHLIMSSLGVQSFGAGAISGGMSTGLHKCAGLQGVDTSDIDAVDFTQDFKQALIGLLAQGRSVTLYPEYSRSPRLGRTHTTFLDHVVHVPTGIGRLSQGFQRPIVGVRMKRIAPARYQLVFGPTWAPPTTDDQVESTMTDVFTWLEEAVREDPTSWEGWRYFGRMTGNGMKVVLNRFAQDRAAERASA